MLDWYFFRRHIVNLQKPPKWWAQSLFGWIRYFLLIRFLPKCDFCRAWEIWMLQETELFWTLDRVIWFLVGSFEQELFYLLIFLKHEIDFDFLKYDFGFLKLKLVISGNEVCMIRNKTERKLENTILWILHNGATLRHAQSSTQSSWGWNVKSFLRHSRKLRLRYFSYIDLGRS